MVQPLDVSQNPYKFGTPEYDAWMAEARKKQFENPSQSGTSEYNAFEERKKVFGYMNPAGVDDDGKPVFTMPGYSVSKQVPDRNGILVSKEYIEIPYVYADGNPVDPSKLSKNANAAAASLSGRSVSGLGTDVTVDALPYQKLIDKVNKNLGQFTSFGGDTYFDPETKMTVVRDENGTSIYNEKGNLLAGPGSARQIGVAKGSAGLGAQIDINAVGQRGTPEYNRALGNAPKQNLAYAGSALQRQAFGALGTTAAPFIVNGEPYTGVAGGRNYVNGIATDGAEDVSTGTVTEEFDILSPVNVTSTGTSSNVKNPYTPGTAQYKAFDERKSAYDLLYSEFDRYGLSSLVAPLKNLITSGASPSEFAIKLRETDAYKKRFAANEARIKNGLRALSEAEYIRNEDAYQEVMRRRGLPPEYYSKGDMGIQKGFENLIAGDVSSTELEDRIVTAQDRVLNANPEIAAQLKQFYPGISNGDILAYALDPANAINQIKRKITAAEIGAAAGTYGLGTTVGRAEQLAGAGVTEATAQQGFKTISQVGPRAGVLAQYYKQDPYTQETAEKEFFGLTGAREAEMQRKKLAELETRAFQGSAGAGAIARDRAGVL